MIRSVLVVSGGAMGSLFSGFLTAASLKSGGSFDVPVQLAAYAVGSIARKLERAPRGN